ncbi:MAG: polyketide synthase, partial [Planctomycetota bacterium]|nr:polyketide synthase [Planctomycetota bacterium]
MSDEAAAPRPAGDRDLMARALHELQRAQQRVEELEGKRRSPIAIVGASCRLPGGIDSPAALWKFLAEGQDGIDSIPADRWDVDRFHDPRPGLAGRITPKAGAFLDQIDGFDAAFFGISPAEAELMDPQQRLLLEACWHAFEDAGQPLDASSGNPVGTFVGISTTDYSYHLVQQVSPDEVSAHCGTGTNHAVAAGRIAYALNLTGPCLAMDTACSSSLVALHLACESLRNRECDFALVAGVNVISSPLTPASFSHARMLAPDGRCKTFAADADGYGRGEGVVALLLTRSEDVPRRGLRARAEVLGSFVNQDGRSAGLTVPRGTAQTEVIQGALRAAAVQPQDISYVEAHGTGTELGDPIELQALAETFGNRPAEQPLWVGSIKTNLGHTEAVAGLLGVLKVALQIEHQKLVPHLHFHAPNKHVDWNQLPVRVPTALQDWNAGAKHLAGVSSFGFSGTNAHAVLGSADRAAATDPADEGPVALPLSAATPDAL